MIENNLHQIIAKETGYDDMSSVNLVGIPRTPEHCDSWAHEEIAFSQLLQAISTHECNGIFTGSFYRRAVERAQYLKVPLLQLTIADLLEASAMASEDTEEYVAVQRRADALLRRLQEERNSNPQERAQ